MQAPSMRVPQHPHSPAAGQGRAAVPMSHPVRRDLHTPLRLSWVPAVAILQVALVPPS